MIKDGQIDGQIQIDEDGTRFRWSEVGNYWQIESSYRNARIAIPQNDGGASYRNFKEGQYHTKDSTTACGENNIFHRWDKTKQMWLQEKDYDKKHGLTPEQNHDNISEDEIEKVDFEKEERETPVTIDETPIKRGRGRPRKEVTEAKRVETDTKDALMELFLLGAREKITDAIKISTADAIEDIVDYVDSLREEILKAESRKLTLITPNGKKTMTGTRHNKFEQLLQTVSVGLAAMIVGPAGSGKTFASEQVAEALDLPFYAISVGSQTSKSDLIGFITANGDYIKTQFREAYENGGIFLMDEIDAGNANVLVLLNSALAGHSAAFPDGMVKKHENFRFIATANTFGTGANRQYVGRNQIDAATLDRFVTILWPVDIELEAATISQYENGRKWHTVIKEVREMVESNSWRLVISPRATIKGSALLDAGIDVKEVINMVLLGQADASQQTLIRDKAEKAWR